jgi:hypothetical protein
MQDAGCLTSPVSSVMQGGSASDVGLRVWRRPAERPFRRGSADSRYDLAAYDHQHRAYMGLLIPEAATSFTACDENYRAATKHTASTGVPQVS